MTRIYSKAVASVPGVLYWCSPSLCMGMGRGINVLKVWDPLHTRHLCESLHVGILARGQDIKIFTNAVFAWPYLRGLGSSHISSGHIYTCYTDTCDRDQSEIKRSPTPRPPLIGNQGSRLF